MVFDTHTNFAYGAVTVAPSPASSGTTLSISTGDAANFPDPGAASPYNVIVFPTGTNPLSSNAEIVRVTAKASPFGGNVQYTIVRTQESSSARSILVGDQICNAVTAKALTDIERNVAAGSDITTGTDNTKFATALALANAGVALGRLNSKIINSSYTMSTASGNVSYTGVGFKPTSIMAFANVGNGGSTDAASWGFSDSSLAANCLEHKTSTGYYTGQAGGYGDNLLIVLDENGSWQSASPYSYDTDGFTLSWSKSNSPAGTAYLTFLCFR